MYKYKAEGFQCAWVATFLATVVLLNLGKDLEEQASDCIVVSFPVLFCEGYHMASTGIGHDIVFPPFTSPAMRDVEFVHVFG